jgi:hypothetical protein
MQVGRRAAAGALRGDRPGASADPGADRRHVERRPHRATGPTLVDGLRSPTARHDPSRGPGRRGRGRGTRRRVSRRPPRAADGWRPCSSPGGDGGPGSLAPAVDREPVPPHAEVEHTPRWSTRRSGPRASMRSPTASSAPPSSAHRHRAAGRRGRHRSRRPSPRCLSCRSRHLPRRGDRLRRSTFGPGRRAVARVPARSSPSGRAAPAAVRPRGSSGAALRARTPVFSSAMRTPGVPLPPAPSGLRSRSG